MKKGLLGCRFETNQELRLKQRRMRQISLSTVLGFGPQKLETAAFEGWSGRVSRQEMQVLHSVSQLIHRSNQLSIAAISRERSKQEPLMSCDLRRQIQAGRIRHESL